MVTKLLLINLQDGQYTNMQKKFWVYLESQQSNLQISDCIFQVYKLQFHPIINLAGCKALHVKVGCAKLLLKSPYQDIGHHLHVGSKYRIRYIYCQQHSVRMGAFGSEALSDWQLVLQTVVFFILWILGFMASVPVGNTSVSMSTTFNFNFME